MRYEDIFYARPDVDAVCKALKAMEARVASASCAKEQLDCLKEAEIAISGASTALSLGQLRYFQDTADPKRAQEMDYIGQNAPKLELAIQSLHRALANSPFRGELSAALGAFFFDRADADARLADEALLPLISEEQELVQRYLALTGQAAVSYEGREIPLSAMTPYYAAPDRARRREAMQTVNAWYEQNAQELDALFDGLVRNRTEQAHKLGYQSYTDMKYAQRFGYGRGQVEAFRAQVLEKWVPLVCEVKQRQRARLGVPTFRIYDSALRFSDGNPRLLLTGDALVRAAGDVFRQIGEEPGAYFDSLRERHMFDLEDRKGKAAYDGFCIELEDYDAISSSATLTAIIWTSRCWCTNSVTRSPPASQGATRPSPLRCETARRTSLRRIQRPWSCSPGPIWRLSSPRKICANTCSSRSNTSSVSSLPSAWATRFSTKYTTIRR